MRTVTARRDELPGRATLVDVANRAGVSPAAASLALRGRAGVAPATRERVVDVATQLGYRGRSSARTEQLTIGMLVKARPHDLDVANAFYGPVMAGVTGEAAACGVDVRLDAMPVDEHFEPTGVPRMVRSSDVDGLLVLGAYLTDASAAMLARLPLVLVDGYSESAGRFPTLVTDNLDGAERATRHLIGLGHRRIALAGSTPDAFPSIRERRLGYLAAVSAGGLTPVFVDGHHDTSDAVAQDVARALADDPTVTAVVAANDEVALGVLAALAGRVPQKVSLIGFDDIEASTKVRPRLSTVAVDKPAMGRLAVAMLLHRIRHPHDPAFTVMQPARLVIRDSVAPPP